MTAPGQFLLALDRATWPDTQDLGSVTIERIRMMSHGEQASGRVIVDDADNEGLLPFYSRHSFRPTKSHPYAST